MMHPIPGGATARPFSTFHNALDENYICELPGAVPEKLVVGGFERVFELIEILEMRVIDST